MLGRGRHFFKGMTDLLGNRAHDPHEEKEHEQDEYQEDRLTRCFLGPEFFISFISGLLDVVIIGIQFFKKFFYFSSSTIGRVILDTLFVAIFHELNCIVNDINIVFIEIFYLGGKGAIIIRLRNLIHFPYGDFQLLLEVSNALLKFRSFKRHIPAPLKEDPVELPVKLLGDFLPVIELGFRLIVLNGKPVIVPV